MQLHDDDKPLVFVTLLCFLFLGLLLPMLVFDAEEFDWDTQAWPIAACIYDAALIPAFVAVTVAWSSLYWAWFVLALCIISYVAFVLLFSATPVALITCCCSPEFCFARDAYQSDEVCDLRREAFTCAGDKWRIGLFWVGMYGLLFLQVVRLLFMWQYKEMLTRDRAAVKEYFYRRKKAETPRANGVPNVSRTPGGGTDPVTPSQYPSSPYPIRTPRHAPTPNSRGGPHSTRTPSAYPQSPYPSRPGSLRRTPANGGAREEIKEARFDEVKLNIPERMRKVQMAPNPRLRSGESDWQTVKLERDDSYKSNE